MLAVAAAVAMLVSALPASVATAAPGDVACKVHNLNKGINRNTLQRAVWDADPGDSLLVQGTCRGTTLIRKDLDVSFLGWVGAPMPLGAKYVAKPRGQIVSGSWRPALVIDPRVDDLTINPGLRVSGGIVIGDVNAWEGGPRPVPAAWKRAAPSLVATKASPRLSACHVRNDETGVQYLRSQAAVRSASDADAMSLRGVCAGTTYVKQDLSVSGWRIAISGATFGPDGAVTAGARSDSGTPTLTRVVVDDDVDSLVLKRVRVSNGFRIADIAP